MRLLRPESVLAKSIRGWHSHRIQLLAAAFAFYALLSLGPLLVISLGIASSLLGTRTARHQAVQQMAYYVGRDGMEALRKLIDGAAGASHHLMTTGVGIVLLMLGASAVFNALHEALNIIWEVPTGKRKGVFLFVRAQVIAVIMVVLIVALFLVSLLISTGLAAFGRSLHGGISMPMPLLETIDFCLSVVVFTALFAFVFKVVPDARIAWREVPLGAVVTSLLFNIGKLFISHLLGHNQLLLSYGTAASFVVIIVWVYFSAQIVLFGAELTRMHILFRQNAGKKERRQTAAGSRTYDFSSH